MTSTSPSSSLVVIVTLPSDELDRGVAGQGGLVHVDQLVDVVAGHGERSPRGQPGAAVRCSGAVNGTSRSRGSVEGPQPVGRVAEEAAALPVDLDHLVVDHEPGRDGDVAGLVRGQVDAGSRRAWPTARPRRSGRSPIRATPTSTARSSWCHTSGPNEPSGTSSAPA